MRGLIIVLVCAAAAFAGYPGQRPYEVEHYEVTLRPNLAAGTVEGTVSIRFHSLSPKLGVLALDASDLEIQSVTEKGKTLEHDLDQGLLAVMLSDPAIAGQSRTIVIRYHGKPERGMRFYPDHVYTAFATSHWMVCNDRPDSRATFRLNLTVPAAFTVVASGERVSDNVSGGSRKSVWEQKTPIPAFVFGFAAGQFQRASAKQGSTELEYLSGRHNPQQLEAMFRSTGAALAFYEEKSGVPFPGHSYSQVLVSGGAEQEASAFTMLPHEYGDDLLAKKSDEWLIAHELAHQWWGIGLTCADWSDFWLNEGMASFLADAFLEKYSGKAAYDAQIERALSRHQKLVAEGKDRPLVFQDWKEPGEAGGPVPYVKGAYFLFVLRQKMGEEAFWKGIRSYTQANFGHSVNTRQFQKTMEEAFGNSLAGLFDQWAYSATRASR